MWKVASLMGRWYTDLKVWKMEAGSGNSNDIPTPPPSVSTDNVPLPDYEELDEGDLPFKVESSYTK
jgi:hypothetical protein